MANTNATQFFDGDALKLGNAIAQEELEIIESLAASGMELNTLHKKEMTFLHYAMLRKNDAAIRILVKQGASPHIDIQGVGSVMLCAVLAKDTKYLQALLESGVNPNATDKWEMPLFFKAVTKEDSKTLELLIEHDLDLNQTSKTGRPATLHAFDRLKYDQVEFLINKGANLNIANNQGITLAYAVEYEISKQAANKTTAAYKKLVEIQDLMKEREIIFPAPSPESLKKLVL